MRIVEGAEFIFSRNIRFGEADCLMLSGSPLVCIKVYAFHCNVPTENFCFLYSLRIDGKEYSIDSDAYKFNDGNPNADTLRFKGLILPACAKVELTAVYSGLIPPGFVPKTKVPIVFMFKSAKRLQ